MKSRRGVAFNDPCCVFLHSDAARYATTERPPKLGRDKFRKCDGVVNPQLMHY